ncbi:hypothetical protein MWU60_13160 [Yoonia sp. F2084L]|uniref:hypothetical protein n=1 Tax=Yoonia sp. F2084L TaxID=2926419 RepID=UPI001FF45F05|nr:hypothetical protein [Yoonia sp. F2084L]MCK0096525.1 hypothetical protein [Yoonia sp. F2084L]
MIGFELSPGTLQGGPRNAPPLAAYFRNGGGQSVALAEGINGGLFAWTELGQGYVARMRLDSDDPTTRLSWRETLIAELRNIYPVGALTLSGSWAKLQSSGSGRAGSYTGNRAISTGSASALAQVTVGRAAPYDLWVHYTGRTSGGYIKVEIDGAQTLVNEIDDPADLGFKAFSSYSSTDLLRRQTVKVASGLMGNHDVAISFGGAASPGGGAILIEAVGISGALADPHVLPPLWTAGTTYEMGDEVQFGGMYYSARANGVSGAAGPSHSGGIASDGALDWRADDRPTYPEFVAIDYPSEREYAIRFAVSGATTEAGGQTHGNDALVARTITLDDVPWVPATTGLGLQIGTNLAFVEDTTWQTQSGAAVADCRLVRTVTPGAITHSVTAHATGPQMDVEWLYAGMLPMVRWDGESGTTVVDTVKAPDAPIVDLASFAGVTPPNTDFGAVARLGLAGKVDGVGFVYGHEVGATPVSGNIINGFEAFLRPNLEGRSETGTLDWPAKAYLQAQDGGAMTFDPGEALGFFSRHSIAMTPS